MFSMPTAMPTFGFTQVLTPPDRTRNEVKQLGKHFEVSNGH